MKKIKLIFILLLLVMFSSCNQIKLENNEAIDLIKKTLELPKSYSEEIGLGWGATSWLDALQEDGLIIYNIEYHGALTDPSLYLFPTETSTPYYLGQDSGSGKYMFKTNDLEFDQITGISIQKESQTAMVRFSLKATNITPVARTLSKISYIKYSLDNPITGELIFKKFDRGWQLQSDQNKTSNDMVNEILKGGK
jgi:hypothetical protein